MRIYRQVAGKEAVMAKYGHLWKLWMCQKRFFKIFWSSTCTGDTFAWYSVCKHTASCSRNIHDFWLDVITSGAYSWAHFLSKMSHKHMPYFQQLWIY